MPSVITWKTEIALGSSPNTPLASQIYTDVSQWVREDIGVSLSRGRSDEHAEIGPTTLSGLTLDNKDGRFTPGNLASPYVSTLDIGTVIRRSVVIDGTTYVRFVGYIDDIDVPEWANTPFDKVVEISASDRLARIGHQRSGTMLAPIDYETLAASPALYWTLNEESEARSAAALSTSEVDPLIVFDNAGTMEFGGADGPPSDATKAATFEAPLQEDGTLAGMSDYLKATLRTPISYGGTNRFTLSAWARPTAIWSSATPPRVIKVDAWSGTGITFYAQIYVDMTTGAYMGRIANAAESSVANVTGPVAASGKLNHLVLVVEQGQAIRLYVDGVVYTGTTCPTATVSFSTVTVGGPWTGAISNVAIWRTTVAAATVTKLYTAGTFGTEGMNSADAMTLLAGYAGIPSAEIVVSGRGTTRVGIIPTSGRSRAEVLKDIAQTEGGILYVDGNGILRFDTRSKRWGAGSANFTLPIGDIVDTFSLSYNDAFIVNEARVQRTGGSEARASDATSQAKRGIYAMEVEGRFYSDAECVSRARYLVQTYKDPKPRFGSFPVRVTTSLAAQTLVGIELNHLMALTGLSSDAPPLGNQWVEGISEKQGIDYTLTFTTSPVMPTSSTTYFRIGSGTASRISATALIGP